MLLTAGCGTAHDTDHRTPEPVKPNAGGVSLNQNVKQLDQLPRLQWEGNYGYCGEVSLISAGMMFGQYLSQYDVRALASPGVAQSSASSQLLLGVNDAQAASAMHLKAAAYPHPRAADPRDFLSWVKANVLSGNAVAIAVYMNQARFYDSSDPDAGDSEYDHIIPVLGIGSSADWSDRSYHGDDTLYASDNGLWQAGNQPPYNFSFVFDAMHRTRQDANDPNASVYSLPQSVDNYGLAVSGVEDDDGVCLPVHLKTDPNSEPDIRDGSPSRPPAASLTLTVTAYGLAPGVDYRLYRYDDLRQVPHAGFNAQASAAAAVTPVRIATGSTYTTTMQIKSSDQAIFRMVPASAP